MAVELESFEDCSSCEGSLPSVVEYADICQNTEYAVLACRVRELIMRHNGLVDIFDLLAVGDDSVATIFGNLRDQIDSNTANIADIQARQTVIEDRLTAIEETLAECCITPPID